MPSNKLLKYKKRGLRGIAYALLQPPLSKALFIKVFRYMKFKKYGVPAYAIYILSYLCIVAVSVKIKGWGFSSQELVNIATFILLPLPICLFLGACIWLFKRSNILAYSMASMLIVSPIGILINLIAVYLLWWSASNA